MYAVIELAGKQFRVAQGDSILVDQPGDHAIEPRVLMVVDGDEVITDRARLDKAVVQASATGQVVERLGRVMRFKAKQARSSKKIMGHRRKRTRVTIDKLALS